MVIATIRNMNRRQLVFAVLALLAMAVLLVVITAAIVGAQKSTAIRDQQQETTPLIESSNDTLDAIEKLAAEIRSCTTPGQDCYERGQRQTADAVDVINNAVVYAAACADQRGVQGQDEIYACVVRRMAHADAAGG